MCIILTVIKQPNKWQHCRTCDNCDNNWPLVCASCASVSDSLSMCVSLSGHRRRSDRLPIRPVPHSAPGLPHEEERWGELWPWGAQAAHLSLPEGPHQGVLRLKTLASVHGNITTTKMALDWVTITGCLGIRNWITQISFKPNRA